MFCDVIKTPEDWEQAKKEAAEKEKEKENQIAVRIENSDEKQEDIKDSAYWEGYSTLYAGKYFGKQDSDTLIDVKKNKDIHFNIQ